MRLSNFFILSVGVQNVYESYGNFICNEATRNLLNENVNPPANPVKKPPNPPIVAPVDPPPIAHPANVPFIIQIIIYFYCTYFYFLEISV